MLILFIFNELGRLKLYGTHLFTFGKKYNSVLPNHMSNQCNFWVLHERIIAIYIIIYLFKGFGNMKNCFELTLRNRS